ncbi:hypothetical protein NHX12_001778 [Muraenolepis orangiensis]|uniref:S100/CaBP-9k-type calcium binding subdomain domain-containing protein n=1 Tax=Muraenolepis orangiensis TaxID=630683 RepID=A0A9Q0E0D6_9TELE|nr:hypothetical protein NHX12_001778 [Muraenolepis orangiensis]
MAIVLKYHGVVCGREQSGPLNQSLLRSKMHIDGTNDHDYCSVPVQSALDMAASTAEDLSKEVEDLRKEITELRMEPAITKLVDVYKKYAGRDKLIGKKEFQKLVETELSNFITVRKADIMLCV